MRDDNFIDYVSQCVNIKIVPVAREYVTICGVTSPYENCGSYINYAEFNLSDFKIRAENELKDMYGLNSEEHLNFWDMLASYVLIYERKIKIKNIIADL